MYTCFLESVFMLSFAMTSYAITEVINNIKYKIYQLYLNNLYNLN